MRRKLFNLAAAVSALVLLLTLGAWLATAFGYHKFRVSSWDPDTRRLRHTWLELNRGCFALARMTFLMDLGQDTAEMTARASPRFDVEHEPRRINDSRPDW